MIYGLYLSGQGAQIQSLRQEVVANNLSNAATTSFKRDLVLAQSHVPYDVEQGKPTWLPGNLHQLTGGVTAAGVATDFTQAELTHTNAPLDLAIQGKGFLRVADGKKTLLTRDGQLAVGPQDQLVTRDGGLPVLNTAGQPMFADPRQSFEVHADGTVMQGDTEVGKLAVVEPQSYSGLEKAGKNLYSTTAKLAPAGPATEIKQGYIEASGVRPVASMMELIESSRALEANVNMIHYQDDSLSRLLDSLPRK
ncbi:MAG TPA: flagellar hook basal-body protein [Planctomycetaceae bacterium]|nr:flagellar hook basal-body protein [Planctomycetaceae bacterium]